MYLAPLASADQVGYISGTTTLSSPYSTAFGGCPDGTPDYHTTQSVHVDISGEYSFVDQRDILSTTDGCLYIQAGSFDPDNPAANYVGYVDDHLPGGQTGPGNEPIELTAGEYVLVLTTYDGSLVQSDHNNAMGTMTYSVTGPSLIGTPATTERPIWHLAVGRASAEAPCASGYNPSWAMWPNAGTGGYVCNKDYTPTCSCPSFLPCTSCSNGRAVDTSRAFRSMRESAAPIHEHVTSRAHSWSIGAMCKPWARHEEGR